jgi:sporulation protein YlmC with PRC-barrel domain
MRSPEETMARDVLELLVGAFAPKERDMTRKFQNWKGLVVAALVAGSGGIAVAEQQQENQGQPNQPQMNQPQANQMQAPVAGAQPIGVSLQEEAIVAKGWSGKKDLLGKPVYNDNGEKVGTISDVIIGPDRAASFAIVGAGGFVGMSKHNVAIPFQQLQLKGDRTVLPGATKDAIRSLPEFVYAR